jgi:glutamine amidotransferase
MKALLIDYGAGNLHSVKKALERAGFSVERSSNPAATARAEVLVLPGQGHFRQVMAAFKRAGFEPAIRAHLAAGLPFLGICVGLQLLMESSEEAPGVPGLCLLRGKVRRFPDSEVSVPHMGWNQLHKRGRTDLLEGIPEGAFAYFAHSYYVDFVSGDHPGASTLYGKNTFLSAVSLGNLHATQFHPEKSQEVGIRVLRNFRRLAQAAVGR